MADERPACDGRGPVDHVLDLFVFAPLGFLAESATLVPRLAESGRQHLDSRVRLARMVGQFAVQEGRRRAASAIGHLRGDSTPAPSVTSAADAPPATAPEAAP